MYKGVTKLEYFAGQYVAGNHSFSEKTIAESARKLCEVLDCDPDAPAFAQDAREFYEDNIDYDSDETTQTPPQIAGRDALIKERDELRAQLEQRDYEITGLEMKVQTLGVAGALLEKKLEEHGFWPCALCGTWERGDDFAAENAETGGRVCWDCAEGWTICERCDCTHPPNVPCPWCVIKEQKP